MLAAAPPVSSIDWAVIIVYLIGIIALGLWLLLFALATGAVEAPEEYLRVCAVAPSVVAEAVLNAIRSADSLGGIPSWREVFGHGN